MLGWQHTLGPLDAFFSGNSTGAVCAGQGLMVLACVAPTRKSQATASREVMADLISSRQRACVPPFCEIVHLQPWSLELPECVIRCLRKAGCTQT